MDFYCVERDAGFSFYNNIERIFTSKYVQRCRLGMPRYYHSGNMLVFPQSSDAQMQILEVICEMRGMPTARGNADWSYPAVENMDQDDIPSDIDYLERSISLHPCVREEQDINAWLGAMKDQYQVCKDRFIVYSFAARSQHEIEYYALRDRKSWGDRRIFLGTKIHLLRMPHLQIKGLVYA